MIINDVPGEECRIAILEDDVLEEFYSERTSHDLHVGNIYVGKVMNVEPSIQAAFIDFGIGQNGFLHVTDLHPMYFPGDKKSVTEAVGQKTPHHTRPPIQQCLKRGQEITVQVLKEGIGTKGPTLTSYLSLPGRYMVMMPHMQNVGVSRRLEDIDERREAKRVFDGMDLPSDFGFILRTAGIGRTKTDLKRDLAYMQRLWRAIDKKRQSCKAPAELYAESDLLVRTVRDVLSADVSEIIVDHPDSLRRIDAFLRIAAPRRRTTKLLHYDHPIPIFHHFEVEDQIRQIHSRTVPLKSGGSLVIDSTEAMVAIDVNSGRMRNFKDAETMAYRVNSEAIEEIARQLRLRDLGGLVLLDLIDMRHSKHQRDIENKFRDLLKRDRAKTEFLKISRFGLIEMTRQRMRPGIGKASYVDCERCHGRGVIQIPELTASDALRELARLLQIPEVAKVEMAISREVASYVLSRRRRMLSQLEDQSGRIIELRVSKDLPVDRVVFSAYDVRGADLNLERLQSDSAVKIDLIPFEDMPDQSVDDADIVPALGESTEADADAEVVAEAEPTEGTGKRRRRRRRRRRKSADSEETTESTGGSSDAPDGEAPATDAEATDTPAEDAAPPKKKRSRRRRRRKSNADVEATDEPTTQTTPDTSEESEAPTEDDAQAARPKKKRRSRRRSKASSGSLEAEGASDADATAETSPESSADDETEKPKRSRGGRRRSRGSKAEAAGDAEATEAAADAERESIADDAEPRSKKKRSSRKTSKKKTSTDVVATDGDDAASPDSAESAVGPTTKKKRSRRRSKKTTDNGATSSDDTSSTAAEVEVTAKGETTSDATAKDGEEKPATKPRRRLYKSRRPLKASALSALQDDRE